MSRYIHQDLPSSLAAEENDICAANAYLVYLERRTGVWLLQMSSYFC